MATLKDLTVNGSTNLIGEVTSSYLLTRKKLTTATDLNTVTTTGIYTIGASGNSNAPSSNWGTLFVDAEAGTPYQIYITDGSTAAIYKRSNTASSHGSWVQINGTTTSSGSSSYTLPPATTTELGGVIIPASSTSHITNSGGTISITKQNIIDALGFTPANSSSTGSSVTVTNNLTSTSTTAALSAYQGKVLNDSKLQHTKISSAASFDTFTTSGIYHIAVSGCANGPILPGATQYAWGTLYVENDAGSLMQMYVGDGTGGGSQIYRRIRTSSTAAFSSWEPLGGIPIYRNAITSTSNDTTATWKKYHTSIHMYSQANCIKNQPYTYGYLLNIADVAAVNSNNDVHQVWFTQSNGDMLHRGGNGTGWNGAADGDGSWKTIVDSSNYINIVKNMPVYAIETINSKTNDTTEKWSAYRFSLHWYRTANLINNQPNTNGYLLNIAGQGWDTHQVWFTQQSGSMYHRGGNVYGWEDAGWREILDNVNCDKYLSKYAVVGQSGNTTTNPYFKVATITMSSTDTYRDCDLMFKVSSPYDNTVEMFGILKIHVRTNGSGYWDNGQIIWEYAGTGTDMSKSLDPNNFILAHNTSSNPCIAELWVKIDKAYYCYHFEQLSESSRLSHAGNTNEYKITLYNSTTGSNSITSGYTQQKSTLSRVQFEGIQLKSNNSNTSTFFEITHDYSSSSNKLNIDVKSGTANNLSILKLLSYNNSENTMYLRTAKASGTSNNYGLSVDSAILAHETNHVVTTGYNKTNLFNDNSGGKLVNGSYTDFTKYFFLTLGESTRLVYFVYGKLTLNQYSTKRPVVSFPVTFKYLPSVLISSQQTGVFSSAFKENGISIIDLKLNNFTLKFTYDTDVINREQLLCIYWLAIGEV